MVPITSFVDFFLSGFNNYYNIRVKTHANEICTHVFRRGLIFHFVYGQFDNIIYNNNLITSL